MVPQVLYLISMTSLTALTSLMEVIARMPRIVLSLSEQQKTHWVEAAYEDRVSLSEWIRRRCDAGLKRGERPLVVEVSEEDVEGIRIVPLEGQSEIAEEISSTAIAEAIATTARARVIPEHRADPKDKAKQEHAPKEKRKSAGGMCEHRVPVGTYCKRECAEWAVVYPVFRGMAVAKGGLKSREEAMAWMAALRITNERSPRRLSTTRTR